MASSISRRGGSCSLLRAHSGELDFGSLEFQLIDEPPGFAVHAWVDDELVSHVQPIAEPTS